MRNVKLTQCNEKKHKQSVKCGKLFIHTVLAKVIYIYT